MKHNLLKVCMLSGLAMPCFSATLMAAGSSNPIVAQQELVRGTVVGLCLIHINEPPRRG